MSGNVDDFGHEIPGATSVLSGSVLKQLRFLQVGVAVLAVACIALIIGLAVGLTQKDVRDPVMFVTRLGAAGGGYSFGGQVANSGGGWSALPPIAEPLSDLSSVTWTPSDGKASVYLVGGQRSGSGVLSNKVLRYVIDTGETLSVATMPVARYRHETALVGSHLFVFGGKTDYLNDTSTNRVDILDLASMVWTRGPDMPKAISDLDAIAVGSTIYLVGGYNEDYSSNPSVYAFDTQSSTYTMKADLRTPRGDLCLCVLPNGASIFAIGGYSLEVNNFVSPLATVEEFIVAENRWRLHSNLTFGRGDTACVIDEAGSHLYVVGGETKKPDTTDPSKTLSVVLNQVEVHALGDVTAHWLNVLPLTTARMRFTMQSIQDVAYVFGGHTQEDGDAEKETATVASFRYSTNLFWYWK